MTTPDLFDNSVTDKPLTSLLAVSPIDGRYDRVSKPLRDYFSEYALIKYRVAVEI